MSPIRELPATAARARVVRALREKDRGRNVRLLPGVRARNSVNESSLLILDESRSGFIHVPIIKAVHARPIFTDKSVRTEAAFDRHAQVIAFFARSARERSSRGKLAGRLMYTCIRHSGIQKYKYRLYTFGGYRYRNRSASRFTRFLALRSMLFTVSNGSPAAVEATSSA